MKNYLIKKIFLLSVLLFAGYVMKAQQAIPKKVSYDLYVKDTTVNYTGKQRHAIAISLRQKAELIVRAMHGFKCKGKIWL